MLSYINTEKLNKLTVLLAIKEQPSIILVQSALASYTHLYLQHGMIKAQEGTVSVQNAKCSKQLAFIHTNQMSVSYVPAVLTGWLWVVFWMVTSSVLCTLVFRTQIKHQKNFRHIQT